MQSEANARYYQRNRERILAKNKAYNKNATPEQRERWRKAAHKTRARRGRILQWCKAAEGCIKCGCTDGRVLDFHHRDPTTKERNIATGNHSWPATLDEICKCDVLCKNCHAIVHWEMRNDA